MKFRNCILAAGLLAASPLLVAQTSTSIKTITAEVVAVHGNKVIYKLDGKVMEAEVPAGQKFTVGGKEVGVADLEPGTTVTATITTKTRTIPGEKIVTVKDSTVMHIVGRTVVVKYPDGTMKKHVIPGDFPIWVDGKKMTVFQVKKGMKISATWTETTPAVTVTEKDMAAVGVAPEKAKPAAAPAAEPAKVAAAPAKKLPKTGSGLPLVGLLGLLSLGAGAGLRSLRRRS